VIIIYKKTLKNLHLLAACFFLLCPVPALSQLQQGAQMPAQTEPLYIAMVFHKITGMAPDIEGWAKGTKEYQSADIFHKEDVLKEKMRGLAKTFNLISPSETITLNTTVSLSPYDPATSMFVIDSFGGNIKFAVQYANEHFNIVPDRLADIRRIKVPEGLAKEIWASTGNGTKARIELELTAVSAIYEDEPSAFKGEIYWPPLRMKIANCRVWSADRQKMLWKNNLNDSKNSELKDLFYQGGR